MPTITINFQCQDFPGGDVDVSVPSTNQVITLHGDGSENQNQVKNFACQHCDKLFTVKILLL